MKEKLKKGEGLLSQVQSSSNTSKYTGGLTKGHFTDMMADLEQRALEQNSQKQITYTAFGSFNKMIKSSIMAEEIEDRDLIEKIDAKYYPIPKDILTDFILHRDNALQSYLEAIIKEHPDLVNNPDLGNLKEMLFSENKSRKDLLLIAKVILEYGGNRNKELPGN